MLAEITRYTKLFWLNTGPYNNLTARKFVLRLTPEAICARPREAAQAGRRRVPVRAGESLDALLARLRPDVLRSRVDPIVTNKNPGPAGTSSRRAPTTSTSASRMADLRVQGALRAELAAREARRQSRRGGLPRWRPVRKHIARIVQHLEAAQPFATEPMAKALEALVRSTARAKTRRPREATTSPGCRTRTPRWTPSTGSSRSTWIPAGTRALGGARLLREPRRRRRHPEARGERAVVRGPHAVGSRSTGSRDVQGITANAIDVVIETGDSGPLTPIGINLPNDQAIREKHGSKSVSLSNVIEAYDLSMPPAIRQRVLVDARGGGARQAMEQPRRRADHEHARGHRPRVRPGRGAAGRHAAGVPQGALLGTRRDARRSGCALLPRRSEAGRAGLIPADASSRRSCGPSTRATRATRWCSCAACARARRSRKTTCATAR